MPKLVFVILATTLSLACNVLLANIQRHKGLDIYFLDTVGGASTLIVTPLGESVLIDTGSREPLHRDADRIYKACQDASLKQIDYLITTHLHSDHFGGILQLSRRILIKCFMDKAAPPNNDPVGKVSPIKLHCVAAEKQVEGFGGDIDAPVEGFEMKKPDNTDNARSIALVLTYGRFKFFAGGDITWNVEHRPAHPVNRAGKVDLYQITHHGLDQSNNPILLKALSPAVCVAMSSPKKGIQPNLPLTQKTTLIKASI